MTGVKCKRCPISDTDEKELRQTLSEYISLIPTEQRTDSYEYERRLTLCQKCASHSNGLCGECGCFCEVRAAKIRLGCPIEKW